MGETKKAPETEASQTPGAAASASSDQTRSLSGTAGSQTPIESSSGVANEEPSKIGRYRIINRLGQGGFGTVYLAHDDDLDRRVAVKLPNPERITHPEDVEAYLIEARILAKLDHPHIVPVFDVGRTDDGLCFVVSKLVEGSDLAVRMGQARRAFRDSAELVAIPKELERVCLKALAKRAHDRYTTATDMAEDLRVFLQAVGGTASPAAPSVPTSSPPASTLEAAPLPGHIPAMRLRPSAGQDRPQRAAIL